MDARLFCQSQGLTYDFQVDDCVGDLGGNFTKKCIGQGGRVSEDSVNLTRVCGAVSAKQNCEKSPTLLYDYDKDVCMVRPSTSS